MRILFVALANSVHTARWIRQLEGAGWDLHLFPAEWPCDCHPLLPRVRVHGMGLCRPADFPPALSAAGCWPWRTGGWAAESLARRFVPGWEDRVAQLVRTIKRVRPDVVHSLEMQRAGYLTGAAARRFGNRFPPWLYSVWGSDLYHFGKQPEHRDRIHDVLARCDYLTADCERDLRLAAQFGFAGETIGVLPGGGGFAVEAMTAWRVLPVTQRRIVVVKGYQNEAWGGRALVALQAIEHCADALRGHEVVVYSAVPVVHDRVNELKVTRGINIRILPPSPHDVLLKLMGTARCSIGLGLTDGTPNTLLEAMIMGALPIQSDSSAASEWIRDGWNGILVSVADLAAVESALRRALSDDRLVETAAIENLRLARTRIDDGIVRPRVIAMYERIVETKRGKNRINGDIR